MVVWCLESRENLGPSVLDVEAMTRKAEGIPNKKLKESDWNINIVHLILILWMSARTLVSNRLLEQFSF